MTDIITAIVDVLKADAAFAALSEGRVYGDELPESAVDLMPRNAVVIKPSGGAPFQSGGEALADAQRFDMICYGATPFEADALRRMGYSAIRKLRRHLQGAVLIHWVQSAGGYLTGRDADGRWPYAFQSFQTLFATDEVA